MHQVTRLDSGTSGVGVNEQARIVLAGDIQIDAGVELVWEVLSAIGRWPDWNPAVRSSALEGELQAGTVFRWKAGPSRITSKLLQVDPPRLIAWTGATLGISVVHVYRLEPREGGTLVRTEESVEGLTARLFRRPIERSMQGSVDAGLRSLKAEAERRAARRLAS